MIASPQPLREFDRRALWWLLWLCAVLFLVPLNVLLPFPPMIARVRRGEALTNDQGAMDKRRRSRLAGPLKRLLVAAMLIGLILSIDNQRTANAEQQRLERCFVEALTSNQGERGACER